MEFFTFRAKKGVISFSDEGFLIGPDSRDLIHPENVFFYTYKHKEREIYHLLIQNQNDIYLFENTLFFTRDEIVIALSNHPNIHKASYIASEARIEEDSGKLIIEGERELIWGYVRGGAYEFVFKVPYRKSPLLITGVREDMLLNNHWIRETTAINEQTLNPLGEYTPSFGIWENEPGFWRRHYKKKEVTADGRWGCQKQFLIGMALILLYIIYWLIFGKD